MKKNKSAPSARLVDAVVSGIQEVKGKDIVHLDLRDVPNTVCDHFVICHGDSSTQVAAIANSVEKMVLHIFHRDKRGYYALEDLWGDAARISYDNVA